MSLIRRGLLAKYFTGVAVKKLSAVETTPTTSNQHEFNGSNVMKEFLGEDDIKGMPTVFIWLNDEQEGVSEEGFVTWYDSRRNKRPRSEYRLYYPTNAVSGLMKPGDTLFFARRLDGSAMVIVTPAESTIQNQLLWMFGIDQPELEFQAKEIDKDDARLDFAVRYVLDELGIETEESEVEQLDALIEKFGQKFPTAKEFSLLARLSLNIDAREDPDGVLMAWLDREELLFRRLEHRIVAERLKHGFMNDSGADVESFLSFSLSVQNRRKARAGQSLENHLEALFSAHEVSFARGVETENKNKPDFLFPGPAEYHDDKFPVARLTMLGAKSTCKDRWRQVLSEAKRIENKHLLTLEPGITENQTDEMQAKRLQLVLPAGLHETYKDKQRAWLMKVADFMKLISDRQNH